jgi:hypothetical protein
MAVLHKEKKHFSNTVIIHTTYIIIPCTYPLAIYFAYAAKPLREGAQKVG